MQSCCAKTSIEDSAVPSVLIVDDDLAIRSLLEVMCRRLGYDCDTASDGDQALEKLAARSYDVALLDLMMPRVSGFEVIESLQRLAHRPAIIVITGAGASEAARARTAGVVHAVVTKPFQLHAIAAIVNDALAGSGVCGRRWPSATADHVEDSENEPRSGLGARHSETAENDSGGKMHRR
jgi:DNA-binding response OmpR family regulator